MQKITNRAKQAEITKNRIYECGVELITKHGFDGVTIDQIAKKAGVSVGTYYYYYKTKYDLFGEMFKKADDYFLEEVEGHLVVGKSYDQVIEFFEKYVEFNYLNGLDMVKKLYTSNNKMFITKGRVMQIILENIIKEGQALGELSNSQTADEITHILFIAARGAVYEWCLHDGQIDLKALMNSVISPMIEGFKNPCF